LLTIQAAELAPLHIEKPDGMPDGQEVKLYGGNAMVFDQFGRLKYDIGNSIFNVERQTERLKYLWQYGHFAPGASKLRRFAAMHRKRMTDWYHTEGAAAAADWTAAAAAELEPEEEVQ